MPEPWASAVGCVLMPAPTLYPPRPSDRTWLNVTDVSTLSQPADNMARRCPVPHNLSRTSARPPHGAGALRKHLHGLVPTRPVSTTTPKDLDRDRHTQKLGPLPVYRPRSLRRAGCRPPVASGPGRSGRPGPACSHVAPNDTAGDTSRPFVVMYDDDTLIVIHDYKTRRKAWLF